MMKRKQAAGLMKIVWEGRIINCKTGRNGERVLVSGLVGSGEAAHSATEGLSPNENPLDQWICQSLFYFVSLALFPFSLSLEVFSFFRCVAA